MEEELAYPEKSSESYDPTEEAIAVLWLLSLGSRVLVILGIICFIVAIVGVWVCNLR